MSDEEDHLRDTQPFDVPFDSIEAMVDLMVVVATADGKIDTEEAHSLVALINTLNRSVLEREVTQTIVRDSVTRLRRDGARATLRRVGETLSYTGRLKDALGLGLDVAKTGREMSDGQWTSLVLAGRSGNLSPDEIRSIIGAAPSSETDSDVT